MRRDTVPERDEYLGQVGQADREFWRWSAGML